MIKPVKRNKRLKWIDSHYAINSIMSDCIDRLIYETAVDWEVPVNMILGKSVLNNMYEEFDRLKEDVCNIKSFNCVVKGRVTKCK